MLNSYRSGMGLVNGSVWRSLGLVATLGITMVASILLCILGGYFLDRWLSTSPLFLVVGIVTGVAAGTYQVYRIVMKNIED